MYSSAGIIGVDPSGFTMREILWMLRGRQVDQWNHTASILALTANANRDSKRKPSPFKPRDFMPESLIERTVATDDQMIGEPADLAAAFCSGGIAPGNEIRASVRRKNENRRKAKNENKPN